MQTTVTGLDSGASYDFRIFARRRGFGDIIVESIPVEITVETDSATDGGGGGGGGTTP